MMEFPFCSHFNVSLHSGGGFFVKYHGLWTLRGVVSSGASKADGGCDVDRYTLFTSVLDYTSWIDDVIKKNEKMVRVPKATFNDDKIYFKED